MHWRRVRGLKKAKFTRYLHFT